MSSKSTLKRTTNRRPRLTIDISRDLKKRIKIAAAARELPISTYIADVLDQIVPTSPAVEASINRNGIYRAAQLRSELSGSFPEDSVELLREERRERARAL